MKIGLLGMGTIGSGVYELASSFGSLCVKKVLEKRFETQYTTTNITDITEDKEIELVVETMGGLDFAYQCAKKVLEAKKHFVTANKLLVCEKGKELEALARENKVAFLYSAACGGGIPYLCNLQEARKLDKLMSVGGILNGTTNFILDKMQSENMSFEEALKLAQKLGYAEADPSSDLDGLDTMRKLVLSCSVGFGKYVNPKQIVVSGISNIKSLDTNYAKKQGSVIRLCAKAVYKEGALSCSVEPTFCKGTESSIKKNINYAWYEGEASGVMGFVGQGAGKYPTATNVIRDINSIINGKYYMNDTISEQIDLSETELKSFYVRLPKGFKLDEKYIKTAINKESFITNPMSSNTISSLLSEIKGAFYANCSEVINA